MDAIKECKTHGFTNHSLKSSNKWRCKACAVIAVQKRRDKVKVMSVEYKGGSCEICGYNKYVGALEFHHKDPTQKDFGIGDKGYTRSWEKIKEELNKCMILCANCHREIHSNKI